MPEPCSSENYAYILECADGTLYCGWTNDLQHRLETHNLGKGGKYTRTRLPVKLVYYETYGTKEEAMSREWHLKQLSRKEKLLLISSFTEVRLSLESDPASSSQPSDPESRR